MADSFKTIALFVIAALCEVGGAYLVWQWRRGAQPPLFALLGVISLFAYAFIQTAQAFSFGRAFAAYGGMFITVATLWGWWVEGRAPDRWDWIGVALCLIGAGIMLWAPRR